VVKAFRKIRIGLISVRPSSFWSVIYNEGELLERFGVEIVPLPISELKKMFDGIVESRSGEIKNYVAELKRDIADIDFNDDYLERAAALRLAISTWAKNERFSAVASQCWGPMYEAVGITPCFSFSELTGEGLPAICEADVHGAITAIMTHAAGMWKTPVFLADVTNRHPQDKDAELFWHCGVFSRKLIKEGCVPSLRSHYNRKAPIVGHWEIKGGDITISRFDSVRGKYYLLMGHGKGVEGPGTHGTWVWIKFNDWPKWEHKFVYGPYIHHCVGIHGQLAPVLFEACRYIPDVEPDPVDPTASEIEALLRG
jgi:L-fucose isomerase-like protein